MSQDQQANYVTERYNLFVAQREEERKDAMKFLFLVHSGGVVSLLTFLGTSEAARMVSYNWWALILFALGIIVLGVYKAYMFQTAEYALDKFSSAADQYLRSFDKRTELYPKVLAAEEEIDQLLAAGWYQGIGYGLAYGAFLLFIVGCILAGIGLLQR